MTYRQWRTNEHGIIGLVGIWFISIFFWLIFGLAEPFFINLSKILPDSAVIFVIILFTAIISIFLVYFLLFYPLRLFSEYQSRRYQELLLSGHEIVWKIIKKQKRNQRGTWYYGVYYRFVSYNNEICDWYEDVPSGHAFDSLREWWDITILVSSNNPRDFCTKDFYPGADV